MGLIKFGGGVSAISGKIGGTVYARNRGGAYARNWAKPTNTPTVKQSANRVAFGNVSKGWAALEPSEQESWNTLASTVTRMNRLGDAYTPTGRQIYLESSNNMRVIGMTPLTTAPLSLLQPTIDGTPVLNLAQTTDELSTATISGLASQGAVLYVLEATKPFADLKSNFSLDYRQLQIDNTAATIDFEAAYIAAYGLTVFNGNQISVRLKYIDSQNGMASNSLILTGLVT